jgi:hypothetical protein
MKRVSGIQVRPASSASSSGIGSSRKSERQRLRSRRSYPTWLEGSDRAQDSHSPRGRTAIGTDSIRSRQVEPTWCQVNADPECEYLYMREVLSSQTFTYDDVGNRTDGGATLLAGGNRYATFNVRVRQSEAQ